MTYPKISILILNWNGLEDTIECLESLKKITCSNFEAIVVDNGSKGNDVEVLRERFGDFIHIVENDKNYGFAEGNNIGMRYALERGTDYILLLNNDTVVDPGFLAELVKFTQSDDRMGVVGPKIYFYDEPDKISFAGGKLSLLKGSSSTIGINEIDAGQWDEVREVDYVDGACFLIKREVIEKVGMFDPRYFVYWEDNDLCFRARKAGYKMFYVPEAKIWHKGSQASPGELVHHRTYLLTRNRILFMRKHARWYHKITFIPFLLKEPILQIAALLIKRRDLKAMFKRLNALARAVAWNLKEQ